METFRHVGFPGDWQIEDILARVLSQRPYTPDLLGFGLNDFYALAMVRRGEIDWDRFGSSVSSMTPDCRDAFFVDFIRCRFNETGGVASGRGRKD